MSDLIERAGWLADKLHNGGDYGKEAAALLVSQAVELERLQSLANDTYDELDERREAAKALESEFDQLRADAARYRWLRDQKSSLYYLIPDARENMGVVDLEGFPQWDELDAAVDAAMKEP